MAVSPTLWLIGTLAISLVFAGCAPIDPYTQYQFDRMNARMERDQDRLEEAAERARAAAPIYCFNTGVTEVCR